MILAALIVLQSQQPLNASSPKEGGWLYHGEVARNVRFEVKTDDPGNADVVLLAPQRSGFVFMKGDTFTVTFAEPLGTALLEYREGTLTSRGLTDSEGGLGGFPHATENGLGFEEAFSTAMDRIAVSTLGAACREVLKSSEILESSRVVRKEFGHGASATLVLGPGRGALQSYTSINPPSRSGVSRRVTCTFDVLTNGKR